MKTSLIFLIIMSTLLSYGQDNDVEINEIFKQLDYKITYLDSSEFEKTTKQINAGCFVEPITMSESELISEHQSIFKKSGKCYHIKSLEKNWSKICAYDSSQRYKERTRYEFKGVYCNIALFYIKGYEYSGYNNVDLDDGVGFNTIGNPLTCDCKTVFSYSNLYSDGDIMIVKIKSKKRLFIRLNNWDIYNVKQAGNNYFFVLKSGDRKNKDKKYIKMEIK